jgi:hypothetical protein
MVVAHDGAESVEVVKLTQFGGRGDRQVNPEEVDTERLTEPCKPFKGVTPIW